MVLGRGDFGTKGAISNHFRSHFSKTLYYDWYGVVWSETGASWAPSPVAYWHTIILEVCVKILLQNPLAKKGASFATSFLAAP